MDVMIRTSQSGSEARRKATMDAIGHMMTGIAANPITLMEVVAAGVFTFRQRFLREMRGFAVDANVADSVFRFFCHKVTQQHGLHLDPHVVAGAYLDAVEIHTGPTQEEIDNAWEVEIHSSEDAMRLFYDGSARHRKGTDLGLKFPQIH
jgi:hypothetical protein